MTATTRQDIRVMHLQEALGHLKAAKAHLKNAGVTGATRLGHLDIATRKLTQALSYTMSGMTIAGVPHTPDVERL